MDNQSTEHDCITQCWTCRTACQFFFGICLETGGKQLEPSHIKTLMDCMALCQAAADSMTRKSPVHAMICAAAALVCTACAENCDALDTPETRRLAAVCRACAQACHDMSLGVGKKDALATEFPIAAASHQAPAAVAEEAIAIAA